MRCLGMRSLHAPPSWRGGIFYWDCVFICTPHSNLFGSQFLLANTVKPNFESVQSTAALLFEHLYYGVKRV